MLDAAITVGYPGSIASMQQQFGRAGRRGEPSLAVMVATSSPLDQYICNNSDFFVKSNPESATTNPDNLLILMDHIKCAAFELPFEEEERFAPHLSTTREMLEYLESEGVLKKSEGKFHWMSDIYPANEISLRTASQENFVIVDTKEKDRVIGEVDYYSAPTDIHDDAIYIHQGRQYYIDKLDWERHVAYCHEVESDYYTDAESKINVSVLEQFESRHMKCASLSIGEVNIRSMAVMFKKIKFNTHENLGWGKIHLPELEMHTDAAWIDFDTEYLEQKFGRPMIGRLLYSVAYILRHIAPVFTLSESNDIRVHHETKSAYSGKPAVYVYDALPGGVGIAKRVFEIMELIIEEAVKSIAGCACRHGCPGCIGPLPDQEGAAKDAVITLLKEMI